MSSTPVFDSAPHAASLAEALPWELLVEISEHLSASFSLGSLASFNITCRQAYEATLSVLYRSLVLVGRDPEGFAEKEKPLELEQCRALPMGWQFVRYLHVGKHNLAALEAFGETFSGGSSNSSSDISDALSQCSDESDSSRVSGDFDPLSLEMMFPNLVLVVLRLREYDESIVHPRHARHYQRNSEVTDTTLLWVHVCKPIQLPNLVEACIIGNDRRETFLADSCVLQEEEPSSESSALEDDPRTQTVVDIVRKMSFNSTGALQPGGNRPWRRFYRGDDNLLILDTNTLDNDDSEESRSRLIAKGIISLYADKRASGKGNRMYSGTLPLITLVGERVPFQPFLTELLERLPLKVELRVQSTGMTFPGRFVQQLDHVAQAFCAVWDQVQLPRLQDFFCWVDEGINEANGVPMSFSGNFNADSSKETARIRGFQVHRMLHRLDGFSRFAMDEFFYQVKPERKVTVLMHTERGMEDE
ncbi:hypothetical protein QFC21_007188 [Naganishia friedmannii]|uniref:Uncharacterized protein n=1 Tax=Naganishia friedmannii TaxID=89922 RepID=A0ACC2UXB2_9TREE|nr:hypothetical protein QFC21_007188 [Naganishia friedmannii]